MTRPLLLDLSIAPVAGYPGTKAMEPVGTWMYERESQADHGTGAIGTAGSDAACEPSASGLKPDRPPT